MFSECCDVTSFLCVIRNECIRQAIFRFQIIHKLRTKMFFFLRRWLGAGFLPSTTSLQNTEESFYRRGDLKRSKPMTLIWSLTKRSEFWTKVLVVFHTTRVSPVDASFESQVTWFLFTFFIRRERTFDIDTTHFIVPDIHLKFSGSSFNNYSLLLYDQSWRLYETILCKVLHYIAKIYL